MELELFLRAREQQGLTYEDIANALGLKRPEIYTILHGTRPASLTKLLQIGDMLGIPPEKTADLYKEIALAKATKKIQETTQKTTK